MRRRRERGSQRRRRRQPVADFDVDAFLARPLVARVATNGPTIRPVWYLWEDGCLWWLTGPWANLPARLERDSRVLVVIDVCDLDSGEVRQVIARGDAEVVALDPERARRKLVRYLGEDETAWDPRFRATLSGSDDAQMVRLEPDRLVARDMSFTPSRR